jgi:hypothetical protein
MALGGATNSIPGPLAAICKPEEGHPLPGTSFLNRDDSGTTYGRGRSYRGRQRAVKPQNRSQRSCHHHPGPEARSRPRGDREDPLEALTFEGFRRWSHSPEFPERGRIEYLASHMEADLTLRKDREHLPPFTPCADVPELWLADAREEEVRFQILALKEGRQVPVVGAEGWIRSPRLGVSFRLIRYSTPVSTWSYVRERREGRGGRRAVSGFASPDACPHTSF